MWLIPPNSHLARQLEQEVQALKRERERTVTQARASEAQWRERLRAEQGRATEALAESETRATMVAEEGTYVRFCGAMSSVWGVTRLIANHPHPQAGPGAPSWKGSWWRWPRS